jgi:ketosteroid isomerase-like protein
MEKQMKPIKTLAILLLITPLLIFSQPKDSGDNQQAEREILKGEEEWRTAIAIGDVTVLRRLIADDILYIPAKGEIHDKSIIDGLATNPTGDLKYDEVKVRIYGETAVVTAKFTREDNRMARVTRVWVRRKGQWQVVSSQLTNVTS